MLTENQKKLLEDKLYHLIKESLDNDDVRKSQIINCLNSDHSEQPRNRHKEGPRDLFTKKRKGYRFQLNKNEQKKLLENMVLRLVRESFFEANNRSINADDRSDSDRRKNKKASQDRTESVIKWLKSDQVDQAAIVRELWPNMDEDAARSLFSKKLRGHDADGNSYSFSEEEINDMYNMKDRFIQHIQ